MKAKTKAKYASQLEFPVCQVQVPVPVPVPSPALSLVSFYWELGQEIRMGTGTRIWDLGLGLGIGTWI